MTITVTIIVLCSSIQTAVWFGARLTSVMSGTRQGTWSEEKGRWRQLSPCCTCQCYSSPPRNRSRRCDLLMLYKRPSLRHNPIEYCISSAPRWYHLCEPRSSYTCQSLESTSRWAGRFSSCPCYKWLDTQYTYSTPKQSLISKEEKKHCQKNSKKLGTVQ